VGFCPLLYQNKKEGSEGIKYKQEYFFLMAKTHLHNATLISSTNHMKIEYF